jgi:hypothetical protein
VGSSYEIVVVATNSDGIEDSGSISFTVETFSVSSINNAPVFAVSLSDQSTPISTSLVYTIYWTDSNGADTHDVSILPAISQMSYSCSSVSSGECEVTFYTTDVLDVGTTTLTVAITDDDSVFSGTDQTVSGTFDLSFT